MGERVQRRTYMWILRRKIRTDKNTCHIHPHTIAPTRDNRYQVHSSRVSLVGLSRTRTWHFGSWDHPRPCAYDNQKYTVVFVARCVRVAILLGSFYELSTLKLIYTDGCTTAVDYVSSFFYERTHHVSYQRDAHMNYSRACIIMLKKTIFRKHIFHMCSFEIRRQGACTAAVDYVSFVLRTNSSRTFVTSEMLITWNILDHESCFENNFLRKQHTCARLAPATQHQRHVCLLYTSPSPRD